MHKAKMAQLENHHPGPVHIVVEFRWAEGPLGTSPEVSFTKTENGEVTEHREYPTQVARRVWALYIKDGYKVR